MMGFVLWALRSKVGSLLIEGEICRHILAPTFLDLLAERGVAVINLQ